MNAAQRPAPGEHAPYYGRYVALVPNGPIVETLRRQLAGTRALLDPLTEEQSRHRYAAGKWSVREVVGHVADSERVFAYRALRIARADATPLPGFDENHFAANARFHERPLPDVLRELESVRAASVALLESLEAGAWDRRGTANEQPVSVRAIAWIMAGHELHHRAVLRERYLS